MYRGITRIWLPYTRPEVYKVAVMYPDFVRFFQKGSRVIKENQKGKAVFVKASLLGLFPTQWVGRGLKRPFNKIEFSQTHGLFKGLKAAWCFREKNGGTEVAIRTKFSKPWMGSWIEIAVGRLVVENTTKKILRELSYYLTNSKNH